MKEQLTGTILHSPTAGSPRKTFSWRYTPKTQTMAIFHNGTFLGIRGWDNTKNPIVGVMKVIEDLNKPQGITATETTTLN